MLRKFEEIFDIIGKIENTKTATELAAFMEFPRAKISHYKKNNIIPYKHLVKYCQKKSRSLDVLLGLKPKTVISEDIKEILSDSFHEIRELKKEILELKNQVKLLKGERTIIDIIN